MASYLHGCGANSEDVFVNIETKPVPTVGAYELEFLVCDGGQYIQDQLRKCDTISMHMAFRVQQTLAHMDQALEDSARVWF